MREAEYTHIAHARTRVCTHTHTEDRWVQLNTHTCEHAHALILTLYLEILQQLQQ